MGPPRELTGARFALTNPCAAGAAVKTPRSAMAYRTSPADLEGLPPGVPHIIGNEAAERFSFYGMKALLAIFMVQYLHLLDGAGIGGDE